MQTIEFEIEDERYEDMIKRGINIKEEFYKMMDKIFYKQEYIIANSIITGIEEGKSYTPNSQEFMNAEDFLSELKSGN